MTLVSDEHTNRREFLGKAAVSAAALSAAACTPPATIAPATPQPAPTPGAGPAAQSGAVGAAGGTAAARPAQAMVFDNSWFDRLKAKHKAVFEQQALDYGSAVSYAGRWISGMRDTGVAKAGEFQVVLVLRHEAVPLVVNEAMWEKYGIGEALKYKTFGDAIVKSNPMASTPVPAGRTPPANDPMRPRGNIPWYTANGHITLACNLAFTGFAAETASRMKADRAELLEEFKANLLPGVILQPNGIYATLRAQEAGCVYIRAG